MLLDNEKKIFGLDSIREFYKDIKIPSIRRNLIVSDFLEDKIEVPSDQISNQLSQHVYDNVVKSICEYTKKFPHKEFAVYVKNNSENEVCIVVKPIHTSA